MMRIAILLFLILGSLVDLGAADEQPSIRDGLTDDENEKNVLNVLTRKLGDEESHGDEFCSSVLDSDPEVSTMISC